METKAFIDLSKVDDYGPQKGSLRFTAEDAELDRPEIVTMGEVSIEATASEGDLAAEYLVEGEVRFLADLACSRCLDPLPFANDSSFTVRFRPRQAAAPSAEEEIEITPDELDVEFYDEKQIDLRRLAIEQIQLSLPMKPLCEDGCLGLCPSCGSNLNRSRCDCKESVTDDRWEGLREIREQLLRKKDS
jgi:uncharacterized protein